MSCFIQIGGRVNSLWINITHSLVMYYMTRLYESIFSCQSPALDMGGVGERGGDLNQSA